MIYVQVLNVEGKKITDQQSIAETFNEYFVTIAERIRNTHMHVDNNDVDNHTHFINQAVDNPFHNTECKCTTIKEIE
jgi:hypothetical protein